MHICGFGAEVVHSNAYSGIELHVGIPLKKTNHKFPEVCPFKFRISALYDENSCHYTSMERKYWINTCLMNSLVTLRVFICSL